MADLMTLDEHSLHLRKVHEQFLSFAGPCLAAHTSLERLWKAATKSDLPRLLELYKRFLPHAKALAELGDTLNHQSRINRLLNEVVKKDAARAVVSALMTDAFSRMLSVEVNAVKRVAEKPSRFDARLSEFYDKHRGLLAEAMTPPVRAFLAQNGDCRDARTVARRMADEHISDSLDSLNRLCETCTADDLHTRVIQCVDGWDWRRSTAEILI